MDSDQKNEAVEMRVLSSAGLLCLHSGKATEYKHAEIFWTPYNDATWWILVEQY